jgi:hypothetical protein
MNHFVYATEQRYRTFRIADRREAIPAGARIYATCTRESTLENLGQVTFDSMSDEEFYELKEMVRQARERAQTEPEAKPDTSSRSDFITRFFSS